MLCWAGDAVCCVAVGGGGGGRVERGGAVRPVGRRGQGAGQFLVAGRFHPGRRDHAQAVVVGPLLHLRQGHLREGQGGHQAARRPRPGIARSLNSNQLNTCLTNKVLAFASFLHILTR
jgi:hypothetical protein